MSYQLRQDHARRTEQYKYITNVAQNMRCGLNRTSTIHNQIIKDTL